MKVIAPVFYLTAIVANLSGQTAAPQQAFPAEPHALPLAAISHPATPRVSGSLMAKNLEHSIAPIYPSTAKAAGIQGSVCLLAVIGKDGRVVSVQAISGSDLLKTPAMNAVRQWTYRPFQLNGAPVSVVTTVTVNFHRNEPYGELSPRVPPAQSPLQR